MADKNEFDLNLHMVRLLLKEPFFSAISRRIDKRRSKAVPTAGVRVNPESGYFELIYNPDFMGKLTDEQKIGVLKHEFYHVVFGHVTERLPADGMTVGWNHATDLAINCEIAKELPDFCLLPGRQPYEDFPMGKAAEWYFAEMKRTGKMPEDQKKDGSGDGEGGDKDGEGMGSANGHTKGMMGDHSGWGHGDSEVEQMARERVKEMVRQAAEEATRFGNWGTVSSECRAEIMKRLKSKVDWRRVLRYFVGNAERSEKRNTIKRVNKRYAYVHPGTKTLRHAKIAVAIDQSGSVGNEMLARFFVELDKLSSIATFVVVPFDTQVDESKVWTWKKGERHVWERVLCGGTDFEAPTKWINDRPEYDGLIILTDMQAPKPSNCHAARMWMTTASCAEHLYFKPNPTERVVICED